MEEVMRRLFVSTILISAALVTATFGQRGTSFTGTAVIYGSGNSIRTISRSFTLVINAKTQPPEAAKFLEALETGGQDALLRAMENADLGRFALTGRVGEPLTGVLIDEVEGGVRIRAVFKRWIGFGELRGGYRSIDYPFGYVEVVIDPKTGRGDGTFFPAAKIRFKRGKNGTADTVEIEDFGTFPGRLIGVRMRGMQLP